jgi:hypothetical protein
LEHVLFIRIESNTYGRGGRGWGVWPQPGARPDKKGASQGCESDEQKISSTVIRIDISWVLYSIAILIKNSTIFW